MDKNTTRRIVRTALEEDIGPGDITTDAVIGADISAVAELRAKEDCVICGLDVAGEVFLVLDDKMKFRRLAKDGDEVKSGHVLAEITGNARALLTGERTALNFLQRLSGIATKTHELSEKIKKHGVKLLDTRKTTPGLRELEKYAVRTGGGQNHRFGLFDGVLVKDNHIRLTGISKAVKDAKGTGKKVEVEAGSLEDVKEAVEAGADIIMLDNMSLEEMRDAVKLIGKKAVIEVSGSVDEGNIEEIAKLDVDWISMGKLTHSVKAVDIGMYIMKEMKS